MKKIIVRMLSKFTTLDIKDYHELLGIGQGYSISRYVVSKDNWTVGLSIKDLGLNKEGTLIFSINRNEDDEDKVIIPTGDTIIRVGDQITLYGRCKSCQCLAQRTKGDKGDRAHQSRVELQTANY